MSKCPALDFPCVLSLSLCSAAEVRKVWRGQIKKLYQEQSDLTCCTETALNMDIIQTAGRLGDNTIAGYVPAMTPGSVPCAKQDLREHMYESELLIFKTFRQTCHPLSYLCLQFHCSKKVLPFYFLVAGITHLFFAYKNS